MGTPPRIIPPALMVSLRRYSPGAAARPPDRASEANRDRSIGCASGACSRSLRTSPHPRAASSVPTTDPSRASASGSRERRCAAFDDAGKSLRLPAARRARHLRIRSLTTPAAGSSSDEALCGSPPAGQHCQASAPTTAVHVPMTFELRPTPQSASIECGAISAPVADLRLPAKTVLGHHILSGLTSPWMPKSSDSR